jgi:replicative DNA helicase
VSASAMRDGKLADMDFPRLTAAANALAGAPIYFRDDVYDIAGIRSYVRQMKSVVPDIAAVVVDYLQLAEGSANADRRELEIAMISKALRRMAKDENLAVIALAQLNDDGELRECRAIGMDATVQVTIEMTDNPGARILRLRQRQGKTGIGIPVAFLGDTFQWEALADAELEDDAPKKKKRFWK